MFRSSGGFSCVLLCFTLFYWVLLGPAVFYCFFFLGFTGYNWVVQGFTRFTLAYPKFYWVLLGSTWS